MARRSFRDRFFTPPVARAMVSSSGIVLAGAGASAAILAGLGPFAVLAAAAVWAARVALAIPRDPKGERIDPFTLGEPWRKFVQEALQARARFGRAVDEADSGPLRDRLREIAERMDTGVKESWKIAKRGEQLVGVSEQIDVADIQRQLLQVERDMGEKWADGTSLQRAQQSLEAQLATAERVQRVIGDAYSRLRLLDARMDEAVARGLELAVRASDVDELSGLGADVDGLVSEMESLRQALEETSGGTAATTAT
jgi:hypothetical protein